MTTQRELPEVGSWQPVGITLTGCQRIEHWGAFCIKGLDRNSLIIAGGVRPIIMYFILGHTKREVTI